MIGSNKGFQTSKICLFIPFVVAFFCKFFVTSCPWQQLVANLGFEIFFPHELPPLNQGHRLGKRPKVLLKKLDETFGWQPVHPKEPIESIMYRAGQASVIDYIKSIEEDEI